MNMGPLPASFMPLQLERAPGQAHFSDLSSIHAQIRLYGHETDLTDTWKRAVRYSYSIRAVTQGPEWVAFRGANRLKLAVLLNDANSFVSVSPLQDHRYTINFPYGKKTLRGLNLFGNSVLFPPSEKSYQAL
jgi:hypothetical protein